MIHRVRYRIQLIHFRRKLTLTVLLVFAVSLYDLYAQNTDTRETIRIIPTEPGERLDGPPIPQLACLVSRGDAGCYVTMIEVPEHLTIEYSDRTKNLAIPLLNELLNIQNRNNIFQILIPSAFGAEIVIKNSYSNQIIEYRVMPPDSPGGMTNLRIISQIEAPIISSSNALSTESPQTSPRTETEQPRQDGVSMNQTTDSPAELSSSLQGELIVEADVQADVFIQGEKIEIGTVKQLQQGDYRVELRHELGNKNYIARVNSGQTTRIYEAFFPKRSTAITLGLFIPGAGHMYSNRGYRGGLYLLSFSAGVIGSVLSYKDYTEYSELVRLQQSEYDNARGLDQTRAARDRLDHTYKRQIEAYDLYTYLIMGTVAVFAINLLDISFSKPAIGFRDSTKETGIKISPTTVSAGIDRISPGINLSYHW